MLHKFVSLNLLGASVSTTKRQLRGQPLLHFNTISKNVHVAAAVLDKYKLIGCGVPYVIGEDGTALLKHLDPVMENSAHEDEDVLVVYGMNGGAVVVTSVADLQSRFSTQGFASTLYVWELIPLIHGAPHIPIRVATNANQFSATDVVQSWKELWRVCHDVGIILIGHVSDGDPKLRAADFLLQHHLSGTGGAEGYVQLNHFFLQLRIPVVRHGTGPHCSSYPVCCLQDFLHIMWRLRSIYLRKNRVLMLGTLHANPEHRRKQMKSKQTDLG